MAKQPNKLQGLLIELLEWTDTEPFETFEFQPWIDEVSDTLKAQGINWRDWVSTAEVNAGEAETAEQKARRQA